MGANASHEVIGVDPSRTIRNASGSIFSPYGRASIRKSLRRRKSKRKQKDKNKANGIGDQTDVANDLAQFRRMDKLRKSLRESFKKKKDQPLPEASKPHLWHADETSVRNGTCSFSVKYMGCVEVYESRGMQVCEEALKVLRNSRRRSVRAVLYVSGDGLRVVDDETKGLIVDQTIEKVSFCAPDRNHERGFSYICRDGTTRRWMCHGFIAVRDSGERLSHAVGCAFAACLERKQKRDTECNVTMTFDKNTSEFTRMGSFRQLTVTERLTDPQECKPNDPVPVKKVENPHAIARPHASQQLLQRQGSFRVFNQLNQSSPFKRQLSLRLNELPSNLERTRYKSADQSNDFVFDNNNVVNNNITSNDTLSGIDNNLMGPFSPTSSGPTIPRSRLQSLPVSVNMAPIPETGLLQDTSIKDDTNLMGGVTSPAGAPVDADPVSAMCQQVTAGLSLLSSFPDEPSAPQGSVLSPSSHKNDIKTPDQKPYDILTLKDDKRYPSVIPEHDSYPAGPSSGLSEPGHVSEGSDSGNEKSKAEAWLSQINSQNVLSNYTGVSKRAPHISNLRSSSLAGPQLGISPHPAYVGVNKFSTSFSETVPANRSSDTKINTLSPTNNLPPPVSSSSSTNKSSTRHTSAKNPTNGNQTRQTGAQILTNDTVPRQPIAQIPTNGGSLRGMTPSSLGGYTQMPQKSDPFDADWASVPTKSHNPNNPFIQNNVTKAFQVQM